MFLVVIDRAFFERADRQRVGELVELARCEPRDILEAFKSSGVRTNGGRSYGGHSYNVAGSFAPIRLARATKYSFDAIGYLCDQIAQPRLMRNPESKLAIAATTGPATGLGRVEFVARKTRQPRRARVIARTAQIAERQRSADQADALGGSQASRTRQAAAIPLRAHSRPSVNCLALPIAATTHA